MSPQTLLIVGLGLGVAGALGLFVLFVLSLCHMAAEEPEPDVLYVPASWEQEWADWSWIEEELA